MEANLQFEFTPSPDFLSELRKIIRSEVTAEISGLSKKIDETLNQAYITRHETAKMLGISLPTLDSRVKDGSLTAYRIGNRTLFRLKEINEKLPEK